MTKDIYRYVLTSDVPIIEVGISLFLSILATQSLHGDARVRRNAAYCLDAAQGTCVIDASTPVGRDINRLFVGFLNREFGPDAFNVKRQLGNAESVEQPAA